MIHHLQLGPPINNVEVYVCPTPEETRRQRHLNRCACSLDDLAEHVAAVRLVMDVFPGSAVDACTLHSPDVL